MLTRYKALTPFKRAIHSGGYETIAQDIKKLYGKSVNKITKLGGYGNKVNFMLDDEKNKYILKVKFAVDEQYKSKFFLAKVNSVFGIVLLCKLKLK